MEGKSNNYISLQEATKFCKYSQEYLSLRARRGKLKALKMGRNWVTKKEWIKEYIGRVEEYNNTLEKNKITKMETAHQPRRYRRGQPVLPPENLPVEAIGYIIKKVIKKNVVVTGFFAALRMTKAMMKQPAVVVGLAPTPKWKFIWVWGLVFVLLVGGAVWGKESLGNVYAELSPKVQEMSEKIDPVRDLVIPIGKKIPTAVYKISNGIDYKLSRSRQLVVKGGREVKTGFFAELVLSFSEVLRMTDKFGHTMSKLSAFTYIVSRAGDYFVEGIDQSFATVGHQMSNTGRGIVAAISDGVRVSKGVVVRVSREGDLLAEEMVAEIPQSFANVFYPIGQAHYKGYIKAKRSLDFYVTFVGGEVKTGFFAPLRMTVEKGVASVQGAAWDAYLAMDEFVDEEIKTGFFTLLRMTSRGWRFVTEPWRVVEVEREVEEVEEVGDVGEVREVVREIVKEVTQITEIQPVKEITKIVKTIDDKTLKLLKGQVAELQVEMTKRLYAPGGVITQRIYVSQPVQSPKFYQQDGDIVFQTVGSGSVIMSAATGLQMSGDQIVLNATDGTNPLIYLADETRIAGPVTAQTLLLNASADFVGNVLDVQKDGTVLLSVSDAGSISTAGDISASAYYGDGSNLTGVSAGQWTQSGTDLYPNTLTWNVGIATSSPRATLDVWGSVALGTTTVTATPLLYVDSGNGLVGIGTTTPSATFAVAGQTYLSATTTINNDLVVGGSDLFVNTATGYVGIGTTSPDGALQVTGNYVRIGDAGTINYVDGDGDLYVEDELEVDGSAIFLHGVSFTSVNALFTQGLTVYDDYFLGIGSADWQDSFLSWETAGNDHMEIGVSVGSANHGGFIVIEENEDFNTDWGHATSADPRIYIQSSDAISPSDYISFWHDQTDANIEAGTGDLKIATLAGDIVLSATGGNVGIGTNTPGGTLEVVMSAFDDTETADSLTSTAYTSVWNQTVAIGNLLDVDHVKFYAQAAGDHTFYLKSSDGAITYRTATQTSGGVEWITFDITEFTMTDGTTYRFQFDVPSQNISYEAGTYTGTHWSCSICHFVGFGDFSGHLSMGLIRDEKDPFIYKVGKIGIGTTSPRTLLDVWGSVALGTTTVTATPLLYVDSGSGLVGIGTSTPSALLTIGDGAGFKVSSAGALTGASGNISMWTNDSGYNLQSFASSSYSTYGYGTSTYLQLSVYFASTTPEHITSLPSSDYLSWANASTTYFPLAGGVVTASSTFMGDFTVGSTSTQLFVDAGGNVGIGTSTPSALLTIGDGAGFKVSSSGGLTGATGNISMWTNDSGYNLQGFASSTYLSWANATSTYLSWANASTTYFPLAGGVVTASSTFMGDFTVGSTSTQLFVDAGGNVGIATTSPRSKLDVWGNVALGTTTDMNTPVLYVDSYNGRVGIATTTPSALLHIHPSSAWGSAALLRIATSTTEALYVDSSGRVGIGTLNPKYKLDILDSSNPQLGLINVAGSATTTFEVDILGNLTITVSGDTITIPDDNFKICSGGACPTITISGTGNLVVEGDIFVDASGSNMGEFKKNCPSGYVWVPGSAKFGTMPGFCVMKYEARDSGGDPDSTDPTVDPWVSISQENARAECASLGEGYHLISESEWMTIVENIAATAINDLDKDTSGPQLAGGMTDDESWVEANMTKAATSTAGADPATSGCNLDVSLEHTDNATSTTCEVRGLPSDADGSVDDNEKGFCNTAQAWAGTWSAGGGNDSQLRTHILSNGNVLWDFSGNAWEWTDAIMTIDDMPEGTNSMKTGTCSFSAGGPGDPSSDSIGSYVIATSTCTASGITSEAHVFVSAPNVLEDGLVLEGATANTGAITLTIYNTTSTAITTATTTWSWIAWAPKSEWLDYTSVVRYKGIDYIKPPDDGWTATNNGIGRIYTDAGDTYGSVRAFKRGGYWSITSYAGVFSLDLTYAPSDDVHTALGFRCSR